MDPVSLLFICIGAIGALVIIYFIFRFIGAIFDFIVSFFLELTKRLSKSLGAYIRENSKDDRKLSEADDETIGFITIAFIALAVFFSSNSEIPTPRQNTIKSETNPSAKLIESTFIESPPPDEDVDEGKYEDESPFYFMEGNSDSHEENENDTKVFQRSKPFVDNSKKEDKPLNVFLIHAFQDKKYVRDINKRLIRHGIKTWFDEQDIYPGQDWDIAIRDAMGSCDVIIMILSNNSVSKEGYIQKEMRIAYDPETTKLEDSIFIIPAKIEECEVPKNLSRKHWVNLFEDNGFDNLIKSLRARAKKNDLPEPSLTMKIEKAELARIVKQIDDDNLLAKVAICNEYEVVSNDYNLVSTETAVMMLRIAEQLQEKPITQKYYEEFHNMKLGETGKNLIYVFKDVRIGISLAIVCSPNVSVVNIRKSIQDVFKREFGVIINFALIA